MIKERLFDDAFGRRHRALFSAREYETTSGQRFQLRIGKRRQTVTMRMSCIGQLREEFDHFGRPPGIRQGENGPVRKVMFVGLPTGFR